MGMIAVTNDQGNTLNVGGIGTRVSNVTQIRETNIYNRHFDDIMKDVFTCLLYTSPSPRD